jgi:hypothetical protein
MVAVVNGEAVTMGGLVLGLGLVILNVGTWWPGVKRLQKDPAGHVLALCPFLYSWCYGVLLILCAGGLIGWAAGAALWGGNWGGDAVLVWGVGGQAQDTITRGTAQVLTNGGHAVVLLMLFVLVVLARRARSRAPIWQGVLSGVLMGKVAGVAGAAAVPLASTVNLLGAWMSTGVLA